MTGDKSWTMGSSSTRGRSAWGEVGTTGSENDVRLCSCSSLGELSVSSRRRRVRQLDVAGDPSEVLEMVESELAVSGGAELLE